MSADTMSQVFAALADPTRLDMVTRLSGGDATVNQLAEPYRMSLQAIYKHLRVLESAGLVTRPPGPQPRAVHLETEVFDQMQTWIERYRRRAEERYARLDALLKSDALRKSDTLQKNDTLQKSRKTAAQWEEEP
ncbi:ArsR/SmtB family transcription factor [Actinoplanes derwentensis]|uniref:DNA-binding transcriptional regulator, ArsR family n=1 Tax=Actinoplanes derwentensis TaxID=113562 RepID=A0A1H2AQE8_9ACTN|nr:metalloregulator ArsR/SmtB family transcription factor [Actinoplanes derwentensis]GID84391.1 transcriptional regulator [Actinoplanes derwentensis]SDT48144.1 DNA-binding transcriptional regulator, ArsR family [Actinoplanes derwentensis]